MFCLLKPSDLGTGPDDDRKYEFHKLQHRHGSFIEGGEIDLPDAKAGDFVLEWTWGYAWARGGLDRKTCALLDLAILTAMGKAVELPFHVKSVLDAGGSADEIKGVLLHATAYAGVPAGLQAFRIVQDGLEGADVQMALAGGSAKSEVAAHPKELEKYQILCLTQGTGRSNPSDTSV